MDNLESVNELVGLCKSVSTYKEPINICSDFNYSDDFIVIYMNKKLFELNDKVGLYVFILDQFVYEQYFTISHIIEGTFIFDQISIPFIKTLIKGQRSLIPCYIGIARNDTPILKANFNLKNNNQVYTC